MAITNLFEHFPRSNLLPCAFQDIGKGIRNRNHVFSSFFYFILQTDAIFLSSVQGSWNTVTTKLVGSFKTYIADKRKNKTMFRNDENESKA